MYFWGAHKGHGHNHESNGMLPVQMVNIFEAHEA